MSTSTIMVSINIYPISLKPDFYKDSYGIKLLNGTSSVLLTES